MLRLVDGVVGVFSPGAALRRKHLRRMETDAEYRELFGAMLRARGYRAAERSAIWSRAGGRTADEELSPALPALRNRSRQIARDDPIGSGLIANITRNVVGTSRRPQARTDDARLNAALEEIWAERCDRLAPAESVTVGELQSLLVARLIEDGEVFIKRASRPGEPLWYEVIEGDRVATPPGAVVAGDIVDGVERDDAGRPLAYWVLRYVPGRPVSMGLRADDYQRVPAEEVYHLRLKRRPGQTRGEPMLHAVLQDLRDLDLLMVAALKRVQVAACLSVFIRSPHIERLLPPGDAMPDDFGHKLAQSLEPGMIFKLLPQEEIDTVVPNFPTPELAPFIVAIARRIGAALGLSWQVVLKDFSSSTYSSARTDLLESRVVYTGLQYQLDAALSWMWAGVMLDAALRGDVRLRDMTAADATRVHWAGDGWRWIDPLKEVASIRAALEAGLTTYQIECARLGLDWEEVISQRARERQALIAAGLPVPAAWDSVAVDDDDDRPRVAAVA